MPLPLLCSISDNADRVASLHLGTFNIQAKLREGYCGDFEHWATVENLKRSAKPLIYIKESGINTYEELEKKCAGS